MKNKYNINYEDPRQDVHIERKHNPNLFRYDVAEKFLPITGTGLKVLELGGGIAELTRRMIGKGFDVSFVDLSEKNLEKAKYYGASTYNINLNDGLPEFGNNQFDVVVILEVIEHIVAAENLLLEISRVLKKGGLVILSTPNFNFIENRFKILFGKLSFDEGYHYRFFNPNILKFRLASVGISLVKTNNTCPAFGYNILLNKVFKKPRKHIRVPDFLSSVFAHTLFVLGVKK